MRTMQSIMSFCYDSTKSVLDSQVSVCLCIYIHIYNMCSPIYPLVCFHACHVMAVHGCFLASAKWPCAVSCPMDQCGPLPRGAMWP